MIFKRRTRGRWCGTFVKLYDFDVRSGGSADENTPRAAFLVASLYFALASASFAKQLLGGKAVVFLKMRTGELMVGLKWSECCPWLMVTFAQI